MLVVSFEIYVSDNFSCLPMWWPVMLGLGLGLRPQNVGLGLGLEGCGLGLGLEGCGLGLGGCGLGLEVSALTTS